MDQPVKIAAVLFAWLAYIGSSAQALYVASNQTLTVAAGTNLYVDNNLTNNGTVDLKASQGSHAQLLLTGTYSGTGTLTQEQYLASGWHLIASPVSNGFNATSNGSTSALYAFNTDAAGGNPSYTPWSTSYNETNRGYYARAGSSGNFLTAAGVVSVGGTANTSSASRVLNQTAAVTSNGSANGSGLGWHLIGNPYTCSVDWFTWRNGLSSINAAMYRWDPTLGGGTGGYVTTTPVSSGTALIAPLQGFWVQVSDPNGATLPATTMAAHGTLGASTFYKQLPPRMELNVKSLDDSTRSDELVLADVAGASLAFEGETDAWKLRNGPGMPNLMARDDATGQETSINALDLGSPGAIPVNFRGGSFGEKWTISVGGDWEGDAVLEDRLLASFNDLRNSPYTFVHREWSLDESRFRLHFVPTASLGNGGEAAGDALVAYASGEWLVVHRAQSCALYALDGRLMAESAGDSAVQLIPRPSAGLYVITCGTQRVKLVVP
jgi:hypothetical protein